MRPFFHLLVFTSAAMTAFPINAWCAYETSKTDKAVSRTIGYCWKHQAEGSIYPGFYNDLA